MLLIGFFLIGQWSIALLKKSRHVSTNSRKGEPTRKKTWQWNTLSPSMMVLLGIATPIFSFALKGSFSPFVPLVFFVMALFEVVFRRQHFIPSNVSSLIAAVVFIVAFKWYGFDLMVVPTARFEPRIPLDARVIVQNMAWRLPPGDLIVLRRDGVPKSYVGEVKDIWEEIGYYLVSRGGGGVEYVRRNQVKGKIVFVIK